MIHRVVFGSIERFIGILIEHYGGKFPTWLAPIQVKILPVSDKFLPYGKQIMEKLQERDIQVELDERKKKLGYKIREERLDKVPYMMIIGKQELENSTVSVRCRDGEEGKQELGEMSLKDFFDLFKRAKMKRYTCLIHRFYVSI